MSTTTDSFKLENVSASFNFPAEEEKIQQYWEKIDAFQTSLKKSEGKKLYTFYDGPPFATGLPHYGHILAGTIKDTVTRYSHQTGHYVERRFGWDTHGLPIEFEIEKQLGIKTKEEVMKLGIENYNAECRKIVMRYAGEWRKIVTRLGRWIDFDNDYKTMNITFMESVWWVFKQLYDKGLVYRGHKVMPYSTSCTTALSNFEANLDYREVSDPAITVAFPLVDDPSTSLVAWTTTPWTLPSNLCLCVNPDFEYVKVLDKPSQKHYIIATSRLTEVYPKNKKDDYTIVEKMKGSDLKDKKYVPLFDYFYESFKDSAFRVVCDGYVTSTSGTGVVHCAPGFGEEDNRVCLTNEITKKDTEVPCPVDPNGRFLSIISEWKGIYVKDADASIIEKIKSNGRLVKKASIKHSYPFCWRSESPLIYRAIPSWFVRVEQIKEKLLKNNNETYWVPEFVKTKRFHNWLEDARDWAVSRSRYWGTPLPIWVSDDWQEIKVIGSVEELEKLSGQKVTDLHREYVDKIEIPSEQGKGMLKRIEDVFDCWFESGSMPYAQIHYPFENQDKFTQSFPADFIAEGLDQTRGWFYTLLVLSTALFDKPPFKNLIVNGLVLASDGKKMSKRLKNYPDPMHVVNKYGADALRLYLINSPVVRAESLKFQESGVNDVVKDVFLPWLNAYRFFVQNAKKYHSTHGKLFTSAETSKLKSNNIMDNWITSMTQSLVKFVRQEMAGYRLYTVVPKLVTFIDQLTNWYVRMNRKRLKGDAGTEDWYNSLATLFDVLYITCRTLAPFIPFLTEVIYLNLRSLVPESEREDSVHFTMIPEYDESKVNIEIETAIARMQNVIEVGRTLRDKKGVGLKFPVSEYIVCHTNESYLKDVDSLSHYIKEELNSKTFKSTPEIKDFIKLSASPESKLLGARLKTKLREVTKAVVALTHEDVVKILNTGSVELCGEKLVENELRINRQFIGDESKYLGLTTTDGSLLVLNFIIDEQLKREGTCRMASSNVQQLRKKAGLVPEDRVHVYFSTTSSEMLKVFTTFATQFGEMLKGMTFDVISDETTPWSGKSVIIEEDYPSLENLKIVLTKSE